MKLFKGITLRVALLGWLVTLVTLAVFVVVIIPQQENEFKMNLESKARGVAASIKAVAAGAAVSEDYSVVVDQAMQVLAGDERIDFVVITKNDGFSVITDRATWKTETLGELWRPARRAPVSSIGTVPILGRRVFHFATPFDYSGIEWGWVHIGLSLQDYDASVRRSYIRTLVLTLLCSALSLLVSLLYARHLVHPVHVLHAAVEKVAEGDLHARADVATSDEIGELAGAFNSMTATILARNSILESVGFAAQELLRATEWSTAMEGILEHLGRATGACCAQVFEWEQRDGAIRCVLRRQWAAGPMPSNREYWQHRLYQDPAFQLWAARLSSNELIEARRAVFGESLASRIPPGIQSLIAIPVAVGDSCWGFLCFEDCRHEREWSEAEKESLRAVANMLGATIIRHRAQNALLEANNTLECRVIERTRELQEQVAAKERAHADLAAAQQRLVDLSRQAGMAEVATGVLHNVGNVLNSVNVATTLVLEKIQQSRVQKLATVVGLLQQHEHSVAEFLQSDEKGRHVVPYLSKLSEHMLKERDSMLTELGNLSRHVGHIKEIVAAQQGYATTAGFVEKVSLRKLAEDAIALSIDGLDRHGIKIHSHIEDLPELLTDKHKVLQILLNLLRNAKDATKASGRQDKEIQLRIGQAETGGIRIQISDNGIGMRSEDLQRVFQHGFTTKSGGHGFGLHSGALAAKDLGGNLSVQSDGPGLGATFTLDLPLRTASAPDRRKLPA
ncbi:MAG: HAMP domain-containing protein [Acidobacteria bacterium]|nr:HAMP domain-containing protein [Acidobacteriota bacterium]